MNNSGDAAEQIVRMSLEGVEVAAKITGAAAKEIAVMLIAALKSDTGKLKSKGKARLESMLKSGKPLEIFSVKESDLKKFAVGAKQYGIVYSVLRDRNRNPDGLCDIMVKADDAPKINRVVERFKFATVDKAKIESEIVQAREEKAAATEPDMASETGQTASDVNETGKLIDELLGNTEGTTAPEISSGNTTSGIGDISDPNFFQSAAEKSHPSEPISGNKSKSEGGISEKPSVKEELREIKTARKKKETDSPKRNERAYNAKPKASVANTHKQPERGKKPKPKKVKAVR